MRGVWLLALLVLVGGCAGQDPAPPPASDAGDEPADEDDEMGDEGTDPGDDADASDGDTNDTDDEEVTMQIHSPAFADGDPIPEEHSKDEGNNTSPALNLTDVPDEANSLALIVDDPDAPREEPWVHWLVWNIPPQADTIPEGYPPSGDGKAFDATRQGTNDFGNERYDGPAPPPSDDPHRYRFQPFALEGTLDVEEGAERGELEDAMQGSVIAEAQLVGTYDR
jgi:Raf kinase inhibitor-like YbhB/YbcL family protein